MADTKISALTAASALGGAEALAAVQSGGNVRITPAQLLSYVLGAAATAEAVQDIVGGLLTASAGVTIAYDDAGNTLTIGFDPTNSGLVEAMQDMIGGGFLAAGAGIALTYNDTANVLTIASTNPKANVATSDPTATSDSAAGYAAGSSWLNTATGIRWACLDASAGAAIWVAMGINDHPGYVSGGFYPASSVAHASATVTADTLYAARIVVKARVTVAGLSFYVSPGATGNARLGIYSNVSGRPGAKLAEVATPPSTGTAGSISASFPANVVLNPGVYWLASLYSAAPGIISIAATDVAQTEFIGGSTAAQAVSSAISAGVTGLTGTGATYAGGLPASFGTATVRYNVATPLLAINVA